jgi:hypothetical protein
VPLAGLDPAACYSGDGSAQTLCSIVKMLVGGERRKIAIVSSVSGCRILAPLIPAPKSGAGLPTGEQLIFSQ